MLNGLEQLKRDLNIISAMSDEMIRYLNSAVLFWPMTQSAYPKLTLGSYMMRLQRLQKLTNLLDEDERFQLSTIVDAFQAITTEQVVQVEQKASQELDARIRQWEQQISDFNLGTDVSRTYYKTDAQIRVMITVLIQLLQTPPYQLNPQVQVKVGKLDGKLQTDWQAGEFVWPGEWRPAYAEKQYWWLYGTPIAKES